MNEEVIGVVLRQNSGRLWFYQMCSRERIDRDRKNFIGKLFRGIPVKRNSCQEFMHWLHITEHQATFSLDEK